MKNKFSISNIPVITIFLIVSILFSFERIHSKEIYKSQYKINEKLDEKSIKKLPVEQLGFLRNEIYARYGRTFKSSKYKNFFESQKWYKINKEYSDNILTEIDKENVKLIQKLEKETTEKNLIVKKTGEKNNNIASMINIDIRNLVEMDKDEISFIRNEIYAKYGRIFKNKKYRDYFWRKSWYKPNHAYSDEMLTEQDKINIKLLQALEKPNKKDKILTKSLIKQSFENIKINSFYVNNIDILLSKRGRCVIYGDLYKGPYGHEAYFEECGWKVLDGKLFIWFFIGFQGSSKYYIFVSDGDFNYNTLILNEIK